MFDQRLKGVEALMVPQIKASFKSGFTQLLKKYPTVKQTRWKENTGEHDWRFTFVFEKDADGISRRVQVNLILVNGKFHLEAFGYIAYQGKRTNSATKSCVIEPNSLFPKDMIEHIHTCMVWAADYQITALLGTESST